MALKGTNGGGSRATTLPTGCRAKYGPFWAFKKTCRFFAKNLPWGLAHAAAVRNITLPQRGNAVQATNNGCPLCAPGGQGLTVMAKANKVAKLVAVVAPVVATQAAGGVWYGYNVCTLLRALGYAGYTAQQGATLLPLLGMPVQASTCGCQVGAGRQYAAGVPKPHHPGQFTPLSGAALAEVVQWAGQPAKPHATVAPLPVWAEVKASNTAASTNPAVVAAKAALALALAQAKAPPAPVAPAKTKTKAKTK